MVLLCAAFCLPLTLSLTSCTAPAQRVTHNTLFSVQTVTMKAYDSYLDLVLAGKVKTNDVPAVSLAYNRFHESMLLAIAVAQFNTNAPATGQVLEESGKVIAAITEAKGK